MATRPLGTALQLARRGFAVFPCRPGEKKPATEHGCKDATLDAASIKQWWTERPDYNLAVATGGVSGIFVVDIDGVDAEAELGKLEAKHRPLPATVEVITARGRHVWLRYPPDRSVPNSAGRLAAGCDVRGDAGYVLAPPSVHPSGRRYEWSVDCAPLAAAPQWLLDLIAVGDKPRAPLPPETWVEMITGGAQEGMRNDRIARLAGHLLSKGWLDPRVVLELMHCWNNTRCTPPLAAAEVRNIVNSIAGREIRKLENA
jgi:hypothetical protein